MLLESYWSAHTHAHQLDRVLYLDHYTVQLNSVFQKYLTQML